MHFRSCCLYYSIPLAASISQLVIPLADILSLFLSLSLPRSFIPFSVHSHQLKHNGLVCFLGEMAIGPNKSVQTFGHTNVNKPTREFSHFVCFLGRTVNIAVGTWKMKEAILCIIKKPSALRLISELKKNLGVMYRFSRETMKGRKLIKHSVT